MSSTLLQSPHDHFHLQDETCRTLVDLVDARAATFGSNIAFTDLHEGEEPAKSISFAGLARAVRAHAARLADLATPGSRMLLVMPTKIEFVVNFLGCLYAGLIPVPAAMPRGNARALAAGTAVLGGIIRNCHPMAVLCDAEGEARLRTMLDEQAMGPPVLHLPFRDDEEASWAVPPITPHGTAFLQYTSGSTSQPKGVALTHANLLTNLRVMTSVTSASWARPTIVNWLPLYHDLGLIGGVLGSLHAGGHCLLMPTESFLRRPGRWLRAISRFGADLSLAPNFAYDIAVRALRAGALDLLDLSCWDVAIVCAEPIQAGTLARFADTFAPAGFNPRAFMPCYGLAEASLMVTAARRGTGAASTPAMPGRIGSGTIPSGVELLIVDPGTEQAVPDGQEGEVLVRGGSVATGYWNDQSGEVLETDRTLVPGSPRWCRTGDLGRLLEGELFITGRLKDVISIAGRQIHPQDIEQYVQMADRRFKLGAGVAFSLNRQQGEVLAIAQETTLTALTHHGDAIASLRALVFEGFAVSLDTVVLLRPGTIPKTLNGKLRRRECRAAFERGELAALATSSRLAAS